MNVRSSHMFSDSPQRIIPSSCISPHSLVWVAEKRREWRTLLTHHLEFGQNWVLCAENSLEDGICSSKMPQTVRFPILTINTVHSLKNKPEILTTLKHCLMFASFHPNSSCTAASSSAVVHFISLWEPLHHFAYFYFPITSPYLAPLLSDFPHKSGPTTL